MFALILAAALQAQAPVQSLVAAERAFAAMADTAGTRAAFLANLAEDGVVFSPHATNGRAFWTRRPASAAVLAWAPAVADVSLDGDLGWTMGPWTWRAGRDSAVTARGTFVTVWRRTADGWRVAADDGVECDTIVPWPDTVATEPATAHRRSGARGVVAQLRRLDAAGRGIATPRTWVLRQGRLPVRSAEIALPDGPLVPAGGGVAASGDLAYTYGSVGKGNYLRIWRRDHRGRWRVLLDRRG